MQYKCICNKCRIMQISKIRWWNSNRSRFNKILLKSGIIMIVITAFIFYYVDRSIRESLFVLMFGSIFYVAYFATLNVVLLALELGDRQFIKNVNYCMRELIFKYLLWLSLALPFTYPIYLLYIVCFQNVNSLAQ